jgi:hypothetical protein
LAHVIPQLAAITSEAHGASGLPEWAQSKVKSAVLEVTAAFNESQAALTAPEPDDMVFDVKQVDAITAAAIDTIKTIKPMLG